MPGPNARAAEIAIPHAAMAALRRALTDSLGADGAARALRAAGYAAGDALAHVLGRSSAARGEAAADAGDPTDLAALDQDVFWRRFRELFASRGWGRLEISHPHPGVGALQAEDWAEAEAAGQALRPACFFSSGVLASLLGRVAGEPVAVLEVECRARGDHACRFLFGAPDTLTTLHREIGAGAEADRAIAALA